VTITDKVYQQYQRYAEVRGLTVAVAIEWALQDWMLSIGQVYLEDVPVSPTPSTMSSKADAI